MSYTVARAISDLKKEFEGGNSMRVDWFSILKQASDNVLDNINPETLKRKVAIYGGLARGLTVYYCPTDAEVPSDIYDNDGRRVMSYMAPAQFYRQNLWDTFTIEYINGVRFIITNKSLETGILVLDEMENTTGITATNCTAAQNARDFLYGDAAVELTLSGAAANILKSTSETEDITDYLRGIALVPIQIEDADDIVSVTLQLISSSGNYYQVTSTADSIGDHFIDGWNMVRFHLENRTSTGSPVSTGITQFRVTINTTLGTQTVIVDQISLHKTTPYYFEYYSNYPFLDGTDNAWKEEPEDGSNDLVNLNRDARWILHYEACLLVTQQASFDRTDSQEEKKFAAQLARKYEKYNSRHPSSEMPISYSISPNVQREVALDSEFDDRELETIADTD